MAKNYIISAIDIGSSSIKSLAISPRPENLEFEVLSQISSPSFGVRRGVVVDPGKVSKIIIEVLTQTEKELGQRIEEVFVNIDGGHIFSASSRGTVVVSRADQSISQEDIERVIQAAQTFSLPPNREILEVFPKEFIVDGEKGIKEPLGMEGVRLETDVLVLGCFSPYLRNLTKAVLGADLQIADIVASPLAGSEAVLRPREKELGVLFLDIGAGTTGFSVFLEGSLVGVGIIPIGSAHITNDIAIGLKTDLETAERIKLRYGACLLKGQKKIKVKEEVSGESLEFSLKTLGRIIDCRTLEIFEQVEKELKKTGFTKLPAGVVLCGGGAKLPKIKDFAKKTLKLSCRIGKPIGLHPPQDDPQLACLVGLAFQAKQLLEEKRPFGQGILQKLKGLLKNFVP